MAAFPGADSRGYPLQGRHAPGVEPDPLGFTAIDGDRNTHPAGAQLEGQRVGRSGLWAGRQEAQGMGFEINLDDAAAKEIHSDKAIDWLRAGSAELLQVQGEGRRRQLESTDGDRKGLKSVTRQAGFHAVHVDPASGSEVHPFGGGSIKNADSSSSVEQKVQRRSGLRNRSLDPKETFTAFEPHFVRGYCVGLALSNKREG